MEIIVDFELATQRVMSDSRYAKGIEFGEPRSGHPEGSVRVHIAALEANLELLRPRLSSDEDYWKLKFLIHVHDTFKADAIRDVPILDPHSHASLARAFAMEFTDDADILNIIQYHDENFALWKQFKSTGSYDGLRFAQLLSTINSWDLFLTFTIVDGYTEGKDIGKLRWFINEVRRQIQTRVDESWIPSSMTVTPGTF